MANTLTILDAGTKKVTLDTTGTFSIGNADDRCASSWVLHVVHGGAPAGAFAIKLLVHGSGLGSGEWVQPVYYTATSTTAVAAGTAITAEGIYTIPCDQCDLVLDYTHNTNAVTVYARPQFG